MDEFHGIYRGRTLGEHMENFDVEASALHRKLQSKTEALNIMRSEMEKFRSERDQFKLMAETLQLRYSTIKRSTDNISFDLTGETSVATMLAEARERNMRLAAEIDELKLRLHELQGDLQLLRSKSREKSHSPQNASKEELDWKRDKANMIVHLEALRKKNAQLIFDLKSIIDEKEEVVSERDAYKCKAHRQNHELLVALKLNESHGNLIDIDSLVLENKYLQDKLENCENELEMTHQVANKYKTMLDCKRKKGIIKLGTNTIDNIMSHKQVKSLLENGLELPPKTETISELKSLCLALMDSVNDKNLALSHQKKTNKTLATRLAELEQRIQKMIGQPTEAKTFSPSHILLSGYCSATVDDQKSINVTEDSGTMSSDESNKTSQAFDDGVDSLSSAESNKSIISSEYGVPGNSVNENGAAVFTDVDSTEQSGGQETLEELPPELAEMVRNALKSLETIEEN